MTRLQIVDAETMEKVLFRLGFRRVRQKGSHVFYKHPDGRFATVAHHKGRVLSRPLIRELLRQIEVTVDDYNGVLERL